MMVRHCAFSLTGQKPLQAVYVDPNQIPNTYKVHLRHKHMAADSKSSSAPAVF